MTLLSRFIETYMENIAEPNERLSSKSGLDDAEAY